MLLPSTRIAGDMDIQGISAAVSGGASGLGLSAARTLAGRGAHVTIEYLNGETIRLDGAIRMGPR
jgi:NAD(P)-dependent dehydrogenase (short-subunit alcohol dehydrogenase family)